MRVPTGADDALAQAAQAAAQTVELAFELGGEAGQEGALRSLPGDHRAALAQALQGQLPWLAQEPGVGVHALRAPLGEGGRVLLPRRVRLLLRLPERRLDDARELCGRRLVVAGQPLRVGACAAPRALQATRTLHAEFVCWDAPVAAFEARCAAALGELGIDSPWMSGGEREALGPDGAGVLRGRALLLHDLPHRHALALQVLGLGGHRVLGCGLFKPHKAITGLGSEDD